jgi:hypothetical protein
MLGRLGDDVEPSHPPSSYDALVKKVLTTVILSALALAGCASQEHILQGVSAKRIGCPADHVVVTDIERSGTRPRTWEATCDAFVAVREQLGKREVRPSRRTAVDHGR